MSIFSRNFPFNLLFELLKFLYGTQKVSHTSTLQYFLAAASSVFQLYDNFYKMCSCTHATIANSDRFGVCIMRSRNKKNQQLKYLSHIISDGCVYFAQALIISLAFFSPSLNCQFGTSHRIIICLSM